MTPLCFLMMTGRSIYYGGGSFRFELNSDLSGVKQGGVNQALKIPLDATTGTSSYIVKMEGRIWKGQWEVLSVVITWRVKMDEQN